MRLDPNTHLPNRAFPKALAKLLERVTATREMTPELAASLLSDTQVRAEDLRPWTDFWHPASDSYGRKLVRRGPNFELMVMSWAPGDYSAIHDHGVAEWGAVRYLGAADHIVFREQGGFLSVADRMTTELGMVYPVDHSLIHLMGNSTHTPFLSLHLYGRAAAADSITGGARIFDLWERRIQRTDGGVFYCLPESEIERREPCPAADVETCLLHHRLMLSRIERMSGEQPRFQARVSALRQSIRELESVGTMKVAL